MFGKAEYWQECQRDMSTGPDLVYWLDSINSKGNRMNINDVFPSNFLKHSDLGGKKVKVTIEHVQLEEIGTDKKPVLYFAGKQKGLVLNKTKAQILASAFSPETNGWTGREVAIYPTKVAFQGQMVDAIGIEPVAQMATDEEAPF